MTRDQKEKEKLFSKLSLTFKRFPSLHDTKHNLYLTS